VISTAIPTLLLVPVVYVVEGVGYSCRGSAAVEDDLGNLSHMKNLKLIHFPFCLMQKESDKEKDQGLESSVLFGQSH
jgi:hypothetical protein